MSQQPLVSILMNCYNGEKYLRPALESVLAQKYENWELIFWDNQSTDHSAAIMKSFNDPRLKYFYAPQHTELGIARIEAFQQCHGDFVAILDADDISHPHRLKRQVEFLENHPQVALVGSWAQCIDENGNIISELKPPSEPDTLSDSLGWTNPIIHSSTLYRRQAALQVGGYSKDLVHSSDFGLILALAPHFKIAVIEDFLCQLRIVSTSMSRSKKYQRIVGQENLILFERAKHFLKLSPKALQLNRRAQAIAKIRLGIADFFNGYRYQGFKCIIKTVLNEPSVLWGNGPVRRFLGNPF